MAFPVCGTDAPRLIADASVWINLVATGHLADVLEALSAPIAIAEVALRELERGRTNGHDAYVHISPLVQSGRVQALPISLAHEELYLGLVAGGTADTLDDGEAATLVLAAVLPAVALVDERKATTLGKRRFPSLEIQCTTDILFATLPYEGGNTGPLADSLFGALQGARMRVPHHLQSRVIEVLGPERTHLCKSLPAHLRMANGQAANVRTL